MGIVREVRPTTVKVITLAAKSRVALGCHAADSGYVEDYWRDHDESGDRVESWIIEVVLFPITVQSNGATTQRRSGESVRATSHVSLIASRRSSTILFSRIVVSRKNLDIVV